MLSLFVLLQFFSLAWTDGSEQALESRVAAAKNGCQSQQYEKLYFFGPIIKKEENVDDVDQCIGLCWKFAVRGKRLCQAVNYMKDKKRCEMMHQKFNVYDRVMVKYYGYKDPNSVYGVPISCPADAGQTEGGGASGATCGDTTIDPMGGNRKFNRIINGAESKPHSVPWIVSMQEGYAMKRHFCGATLIRVSDKVNETDIIITAAHCNNPSKVGDPEAVVFVAGAHDFNNKKEDDPDCAGEQCSGFDEGNFINHENFDKKNYDNDIAIIKLNKPIKFTPTIQPACLPTAAEVLAEGKEGFVAGWGDTVDGAQTGSMKLMQLIVPVLKTAKCAEYYTKAKNPKILNDSIQICAGFHEGGKDACQGDSGGPLFFKNAAGKYAIQGVVSFGEGCARAEFPGIYSRVSSYIDWIQKKIKLHSNLAKN